MPTISQIGLPKPVSGKELEDIAYVYFSHRFNVPFQKWGRIGQKQDGIDLMGGNIGVQCKNYNSTPLTVKIIESDIMRAEEKFPSLSQLYIVTTAPTDVKIQEYIRDRKGKFPVEIYYWEVLELFLLQNPQIKEMFYPAEKQIDQTQLFICQFLKLCNKYGMASIIEQVDFIVPYTYNTITTLERLANDLYSLIHSDEGILVNKEIKRKIDLFRENIWFLINKSSVYGIPNNNVVVPRFPINKKEQIENEFLTKRNELAKTYGEYAFGDDWMKL